MLALLAVTVSGCGTDSPPPSSTASATLTSTASATPTTSGNFITEPKSLALALSDPDVQITLQLLDDQFRAIRSSDADLFLSTCDPDIVTRGGNYKNVKAAIEATMPDFGQNVRAENVRVSHLPPDFSDSPRIGLLFDYTKNGKFVSEIRADFEESDGNWWSSSPDCGRKQ